MNRVFAYLGRFFVILIGYAVASLAASAFLNIVFIASAGFTAEAAPGMFMGSFVFSIPFIALFVAYFAFIPSVPAILLAEIWGKRDWLLYAIAGGVVGLIVIGFFWHSAGQMYVMSEALDPAAPTGNSAVIDPAVALTVVAAGMCGGIGYWLIAGRTAGAWREPRAGATSPAP